MTRRRWLGLAVATGGTLALAAPAAQAAQDTPLTFAAGTVEVQDLGVVLPGEQLDQPSTDVAGAAGDQVFHPFALLVRLFPAGRWISRLLPGL